MLSLIDMRPRTVVSMAIVVVFASIFLLAVGAHAQDADKPSQQQSQQAKHKKAYCSWSCLGW